MGHEITTTPTMKKRFFMGAMTTLIAAPASASGGGFSANIRLQYSQQDFERLSDREVATVLRQYDANGFIPIVEGFSTRLHHRLFLMKQWEPRRTTNLLRELRPVTSTSARRRVLFTEYEVTKGISIQFGQEAKEASEAGRRLKATNRENQSNTMRAYSDQVRYWKGFPSEGLKF